LTTQLHSELLKHRSTFTNLELLLAMLALILLAVLLHALSLPADRLASASDQVQVFRFGPLLGALFAGLVGALSITGEIRHGTIRPTFLITPRRGRVIAAKIVASGLVGIVFGLVAVGVAVGVGGAVLAARGIPITLDRGDYTLTPPRRDRRRSAVGAARPGPRGAPAQPSRDPRRHLPLALLRREPASRLRAGRRPARARRSGSRDHRTRP